jgi:hypothetical protein
MELRLGPTHPGGRLTCYYDPGGMRKNCGSRSPDETHWRKGVGNKRALRYGKGCDFEQKAGNFWRDFPRWKTKFHVRWTEGGEGGSRATSASEATILVKGGQFAQNQVHGVSDSVASQLDDVEE